ADFGRICAGGRSRPLRGRQRRRFPGPRDARCGTEIDSNRGDEMALRHPGVECEVKLKVVYIRNAALSKALVIFPTDTNQRRPVVRMRVVVVDPTKRIWSVVCRRVTKHNKLVIVRGRHFPQTPLGLCGFLNRVSILSAVSPELTLAFMA